MRRARTSTTTRKTIHEIASAAGVSIATISRAMNPATRHLVSQEMLRVVDQVVARYNYAPNLAARGLSSSVFRTIGVVMPHGRGLFLNDYYTRILNGIADVLLETNYRFKLIMLKGERATWDQYDFRSAEGVDALVICQWRVFFSNHVVVENLGIPYSIVGDPEPDLSGHFVSPDHEQTGKIAAECLVRNGHKRIALMEGSQLSIDNRQRVAGFRRALQGHGIKIDESAVLYGDFVKDRAVEAMRAWLGVKKNRRYTAMFCCNDAMAYGALRVLRESGLRCPDDVSLIGVDDLSTSTGTEPPLTSVRMPLSEVARIATERLLDHLQDKERKLARRRVLLPVELIERASVRKLTAHR